MTVKLTGAQWNAFVRNPWPEDWWVDDEEITVNGVPTKDPADIKDTDVIQVTGGYVSGVANEEGEEAVLHSFERLIRKWLKEQTTASLSVTCQKDRVQEVTAAIKAAGGRVR